MPTLSPFSVGRIQANNLRPAFSWFQKENDVSYADPIPYFEFSFFRENSVDESTVCAFLIAKQNLTLMNFKGAMTLGYIIRGQNDIVGVGSTDVHDPIGKIK